MFKIALILAHSWYPVYCCSDKDCSPIAEERVHLGAAGYVIDGHDTVAYDKAKPSPDGQYHLCRFPDNGVRCFFAPGGMS